MRTNGFFRQRTQRRTRFTQLTTEELEPRQLLAGDTFQICDSGGCRFVDPEEVETAQYTVNQPPRLQLGDAPLVGFPGSEHDQVDLLWQTESAGQGTDDSFTVAFRRIGEELWIPIEEPITSVHTGLNSRIIHQAKIRGLDFNADYEYQVKHLRAEAEVNAYQAQFRTRLLPGDPEPFTFVAYGDSAYAEVLQPFRDVQNQINQQDPDFAILLGDNIYNYGTHDEYDARFDPTLNPEAAEWIASHIDYLGLGNHEGSGQRWEVNAQNFEVPTPVAGVTSPFGVATSHLEANYSFDYGDVHFVTFNSNFYQRPSWLNVVIEFAEADLAASDAKWKVVFAHHPTAGAPDKLHFPENDYFNQVIPRLRAAGADLLLVGHSHTYSWTYPMLGQAGGDVIYLPDYDKDYDKGSGLVQVLAGTGGKELRPGDFGKVPFAAAGFSTSTTPASQYGYASIDVTPDQLTVSYISANDGQVIDEFTITDRSDEDPKIENVYVRGSEWSPEFLERLEYEHAAGLKLGFEITSGEGQKQPLPWTNIDSISINLQEGVQVEADSIRVTALAKNKVYEFVEDSFQVDSATNTATWQLTEPLISGGIAVELFPATTAQAAETSLAPVDQSDTEFFAFAVLHGDVNTDSYVTAEDVDLLLASLGENALIDLDAGPTVDDNDIDRLIAMVDDKIGGDTNLDGKVDFSDFLMLSRRFGVGTSWTDGDFNDDDEVNFKDFLVLSRNFGHMPQP